MKFGFELEAFLCNPAGDFVLAPQGIPMDDCGWLVEYRGEPAGTATKAAGLLEAERQRVNRKLSLLDLKPVLVPYAKIDRATKLAARREHTKGLLRYQNLYGLKPTTADAAGLHISFTKPREINTQQLGTVVVNQLWDFPQLFRALDQLYAKEIKAAKRRPGFYEIKEDQRIEYRSLPNTVDVWALTDFLDGWRYC